MSSVPSGRTTVWFEMGLTTPELTTTRNAPGRVAYWAGSKV
jgi:general stress protein 26